MSRLSFKLVFLAFLCLKSLSSYSQNRDIIIALDESGSMVGDSWEALKYSLQLSSVLLNKEDNITIVRDIRSGSDYYKISLLNKDKAVLNLRGIRISGGVDHQRTIEKTADILNKFKNREKIVVYINDGDDVWSSVNCLSLPKVYAKINSRHYYFFLKNPYTKYEFLKSIKSIPLIEEISSNPSDVNDLFKQYQNLAKRIVGADLGSLPLSFSNNKVKFTTEVPVTKFLIVNQATGSLSSVGELEKINSSLSLTKSTKIEIYSNRIAGKYYDISEKSNTVIPIGTEIELEFDKSIDKTKIIILPITTLELKYEVEGNILEHDKETGSYTVCDSEKEIEIKAFLVDKLKNKVDLSKLVGLNISLKDATSNYKMTKSLDQATHKYSLKSEESFLTVEAAFRGYFQKNSEAIKIIKKKCPLKLEIKVNGVFKDTDENTKTYKLCTEQTDVDVVAKILDDKNLQKKLSEVKDGKIVATVNGKDQELAIKGDLADDKIGLQDATTKIKFKIVSGSGIVFESEEYTFIRETCGPIKDNSVLDLGKIPMMTFTRDGHCMQVYMKIFNGRDSFIVEPNKYTLSITDVPRGLKVEIDTLGKFFNICFTKSPYLCDCFIAPGTFSGKLIATPKDDNLAPVEKVWKMTLEKEESFWVRCKGCIFMALILGLLLWYFYGIWTKPRFRAGAKLELLIYESPNPRIEPDERRKRLKTSFFNRYFIPYVPEKISFEGVTYIATSSTSIFIDKNSINNSMYMNGDQIIQEGRNLRGDIRFLNNSELKIETDRNYIYTLITYYSK